MARPASSTAALASPRTIPGPRPTAPSTKRWPRSGSPAPTPARSAALEVARTVIRRAERRAVALRAAGLVPGEHLVPYLNRLADLVWFLARAAEQAESRSATPARGPVAGGRREHAP